MVSLKFSVDLDNEGDCVHFEQWCKGRGAQVFVDMIASNITDLREELEKETVSPTAHSFIRGQISALRDLSAGIMAGTNILENYQNNGNGVPENRIEEMVDAAVRYSDERNVRMSLYDINK